MQPSSLSLPFCKIAFKVFGCDPLYVNELASCSKPMHHHRSQPVITCSKLTIETLEQSVKYVQSLQ